MNLVNVALRGTVFAAAALTVATPTAAAYAAPAVPAAPAAPAVPAAPAAPAFAPEASPAPPQRTLAQTGCAITGTSATCDLWAKPSTAVLPGLADPVPIWGFASTADATATSPGPVLVVDQGDTVTITVHNGLSRNLSLALPAMTGVAPDTVGAAPGASRAYTFTANRPGTYLYEAGHTPDGGRQAAMGLVGAMVVRAPAAGGRPSAYGDTASGYDDEAVMVLTEVDPALNTSADPYSFDLRAVAPKYRLINGKAFPETEPVATDVGRTVLLRYVNAGVLAHPMTTLGVDQLVVGQDSRPTGYPEAAVTVPLAPGNTVDAVVTVPGGPDGRRFIVYESGGQLNNNGQRYGAVKVGVSPQSAFGGMMTFLDTNPQPPSGDHVGPVTTRVSAAPDPASALNPLTVTADFTDVPNGGSTVDRAEVVVDDLSIGEGTGTPFQGTFGATTVTGATATVAPADLQKLTQGRHTLWVRAHDSAGNWGVVNSTTVNLAVTGAATTGLVVTPNPTAGLADLAVSATGDDSAVGGTVTAAEYFVDSVGENGTGKPLTLGQPGAKVVAETGTVPAATVAGLAEGRHSILVHSRDSAGLWGPMAMVDLIVDRTGPTMLQGAVVPSTTNGRNGSPSDPTYLRINAAFTDAVSGGVNSGIAAAEGFIDTAGANGAGFTFQSLDGSFDTATENTYGLVPLSELNRFADGSHQILVHARDAAGNWGPLTALTFTVDRVAPVVSALAGVPRSAGTVSLTANATDTQSGIAAAEWYEGADPGVGFGKPVTVTATGPATAGLSVTVSGLANGNHTFWVRAKDAAGNWNKAVATTVTVNPATQIFADTFDSGNANAWSQRVGTVQVSPSAAFSNSNALIVTGKTPAYVVDNTPAAERTLHAQFGFAAGTYSTNGTVIDLFQGRSSTGAAVLTVQYQTTTAGVSQLRVGVQTSTGWKYSAWSTVPKTAVTVRVDWANATNGTATLSVEGSGVGTATGNTSANRIESAALGVVAASGTGAVSGTAAIDNYTSNR
ncbi:multicopper oxidase domain-containing protein [Planosporangium sp. 12N6]|uniref:multicopper oxidase domain-containing protein n=1 Tax=Planosporangium spinosum TaxID=3402278 RepID=UPI003CEAC0E0